MAFLPKPSDYVIRRTDGRTSRVRKVAREEVENGVLIPLDAHGSHLGSWPLVNVMSWQRTPHRGGWGE